MWTGFAFLYIPILSLVIFAFNSNKLVTVWAGFSTKWYATLLSLQQILDAAYLSLKIALITATMAVVLGTLVALCLTRRRARRKSGSTMCRWPLPGINSAES